MRRYLFIRVFHSLITLLVVSFLVFGMGRLSGNPLDILLPEDATEEQYNRLNERWGFDKPIVVQYLKFIQNALKGDLGDSLVKPDSAMELVAERLPATFQLALFSLAISTVIAVPIGVLAAVKRDTPFDLFWQDYCPAGAVHALVLAGVDVDVGFRRPIKLVASVRDRFLQAHDNARDRLGLVPGGSSDAAVAVGNARCPRLRVRQAGPNQGAAGKPGRLEALPSECSHRAAYVLWGDCGNTLDWFCNHRAGIPVARHRAPGHRSSKESRFSRFCKR